MKEDSKDVFVGALLAGLFVLQMATLIVVFSIMQADRECYERFKANNEQVITHLMRSK